METMRSDGNVLIPCESGARVLELMQILGKHWLDQKLGMYHLVFLSHLSYNIMEYARSQLEWMSDSLAKQFYNGKPNPFDLGNLIFVTLALTPFLPVYSLLSLVLLSILPPFMFPSHIYLLLFYDPLYSLIHHPYTCPYPPVHCPAPMKVCTSLREMERTCPGPKVM